VAEDRQHQALYRRYRPQTPGEVLGQDHVVRALTGAIREGRLHHAFLFCGPRGTGKTSTARILAKMVNCATGPTAEPCGGCEQCVAIREGTHLDVVEIDAASHGGVEDARELREKAPTAPVQGREKVYIIDEAQRLSREAFDALLKVFEEPPPGVRFVLATTEPHKMPPTIVGRCQRFDFRRLTSEGLAGLLQKVAADEGIVLVDSAAHAIARHAEGSARDALSLLDQAGVLGGERVDDDVVEALVGAPRSRVQVELADAVAVGDARSVFELVNRLVQDGQDLRNVTNETLGHFRDLLLVKTAPGQEDLVDVPADGYEGLRIQADKFTASELARVIELLLAAQNDMRWTTSPRLSLELALIRATIPETDPSPASTLARLERLERLANLDPGSVVPAADAALAPAAESVTAGAASVGDAAGPRHEASETPQAEAATARAAEPPPAAAPSAPPTVAEPPPGPASAAAVRREPPATPDADPPGGDAPHAARADAVDVAMLRRSWPSLLDHLSQAGQPVLRALLQSATPAAFDGRTLQLVFPPSFRNNLKQVAARKDKLEAALGDLFGIRPAIETVTREAHIPANEPAVADLVEEAEEPSEEEALKRLKEVLGATPADEDED
jgi:DNA polymerase-3 subunit gamma/tau